MDVSAQSQGTFANPLLPSGADPYSFYKDGYYYYTHTTGNRLVLWKTKNIAELATAPKKTIWSALGGIISRPAMLGAYMARARQIVAEKGIKGLLCEIRTRM